MLTFLRKGHFDFPLHLNGKNIEKSIFGGLLEAYVVYLVQILY